MLHITITSIVITWLSVMSRSNPLPDTYNYAFFFQVDIQSTIIYSPTQTSVIYINNNTNCLTFRQSLQEEQSPEKQICLNKSIFSIDYSPQGDRVYVVTKTNNQKGCTYSFYIYEILNGMIAEQGHMVFILPFDTQFLGYPIVDIAKDRKIAFYLIGHFYILRETSNMSVEMEYQTKITYELVELQWHPLDMNILFIAGKGYNVVFNLETQTPDNISTLSTVHMNIMFNGSIVLLQEEDNDLNLSRVHVFSYLSYRVNFIQPYTDFTLFMPGLCSVEGNIMVLVRDLSQLYIYNATYQDEELIGGTFKFQRLEVIDFIPAISDGSMALDGSQIYLRGYVPIKKLSRCQEGMYQMGNSCENCSLQCGTCHKSSTLCTSCNSGYFVSNQKCLLCSSQFMGCNICSPTRCLTCNDTANFYPIPSLNVCKCKDGAYLTNNNSQCAQCNSVFEGCSYCESSQKCLRCDQDYEFEEGGSTCKTKSKGWIIGVVVGGVIVLIIGIGVLVWFIRKKKRIEPNEGYLKFTNQDNSAIVKKESFIKSISSEKSSIEQNKPEDLIESKNQISQVNMKKSLDIRVDGYDGNNIIQQSQKDEQ